MSGVNDYGVVADLYDIYVPATDDIEFFVNQAKSAGHVLELMSGTGRVSIPLIEAGVKLTCVDQSPEMLAILRDKLERRGLTADIHAMDVCDLKLSKQFDQIIIPFRSFAHIVSLDDQLKALNLIRQHLAPEGRLICTLGNHTKNRPSLDGSMRLYSKHALPDGRGTLLFWHLLKYDPNDDHVIQALQFYEEYDTDGILRSKRLMELRFRLSIKDEFQQLAQSVGFKVVALYGDYAYSEFNEETSPQMVWVLGIA